MLQKIRSQEDRTEESIWKGRQYSVRFA